MRENYEHLLHEVRNAWRFRWVAVGVAWAVCILGWPLVLSMPVQYQASARIFVDSRTMLSQVTQGITVENPVETQLQRVKQSLLGAPELTRIIAETFTDPPGMTAAQRQSRLESVRKRIEIGGSTTREGPAGGVYGISYHDEDRDRALRVVETLIKHFLAETKGGKREGSEQTQKFLVQQIAEYEERLATAEQGLAQFKKVNVGLMPDEKGDYFARMQGESTGLERAESQLAVAVRRRDEIERQLRGSPVDTRPGNAAAATSRQAAPIATEASARLKEAESKLDELLLRFTDKHPDVQALRETIAGLKERQSADLAALRRGDPDMLVNSSLASNPIYQSIQLQLNQANVEIAALRAEISNRQQRLGELRRMVNTAPEVEANLARLNRDYQITKSQYQALVERLERTRLSDQADAEGVVRFQVIDPAHAPLLPSSSKRNLMLIVVFLAALGAGGLLAYVLNQIRPVFSSEKQLGAVLGLPVLGSLGLLDHESYRRRQRKAVWAFSAAMCGLAAFGLVLYMMGAAPAAIVPLPTH